jgi:hypothetical protein
MPRTSINLVRVDDHAVAVSVLESLREQGLDGSIAQTETGTGEAFVLFWRRGERDANP